MIWIAALVLTTSRCAGVEAITRGAALTLLCPCTTRTLEKASAPSNPNSTICRQNWLPDLLSASLFIKVLPSAFCHIIHQTLLRSFWFRSGCTIIHLLAIDLVYSETVAK